MIKLVWFLRLILLGAIGFTLYLFFLGKGDYGIILVSLIACGALVSFSTVSVRNDVIEVSKCHVFAFLVKRILIRKEDIVEIIPVELVAGDNELLEDAGWWAVLFWAVKPDGISFYQVKWKGPLETIQRIRISERNYREIQESV
ncbi:hypothetical protein [Flavihumibacter petaseus]|uniref:hypothetical protein n=1 Tax=Flavihumibacter petaseus TaxID=549295 RepID=UPI00061D221F|nr:hypothetical protein [Flavihumibacter petaseus]